jgi:hypothetical protein
VPDLRDASAYTLNGSLRGDSALPVSVLVGLEAAAVTADGEQGRLLAALRSALGIQALVASYDPVARLLDRLLRHLEDRSGDAEGEQVAGGEREAQLDLPVAEVADGLAAPRQRGAEHVAGDDGRVG